jgi:hypothetical protein
MQSQIPSDARLIVFSYLDSRELVQKVSLLSKATRSQLRNKRLISESRKLTLKGVPDYSVLAYLSSLAEYLVLESAFSESHSADCEWTNNTV